MPPQMYNVTIDLGHGEQAHYLSRRAEYHELPVAGHPASKVLVLQVDFRSGPQSVRGEGWIPAERVLAVTMRPRFEDDDA